MKNHRLFRGCFTLYLNITKSCSRFLDVSRVLNMKLLITVLLGSTVILGTSCSTTNQKKAKQLRENLRKYPELMDARIKTLWIPDKIEGNR